MKHPRIHAPKALAPAVKMLTDFLRSRISQGAEFKIGQTIRCSWMWFRVGEDQGKLTVLAPQAGIMPMSFHGDSSEALNLVLTQRYICDSFGVECGWCHALQSAIVIKDLAGCKNLFMNRTDDADERTSSGWFFGASDTALDVNDARNLELRSLWELSCALPESRDFFLLPQGWQVVFGDRPVVLQNGQPASAQPNSYYAARYQS